MGGLSRICKIYGGMKTTSNGKTVNWKWDYANDKVVKDSEMPQGSERWKASEKAKWDSIKSNAEGQVRRIRC